MERRSEVYCLWSCDFRNSGGLWEGGCVGGKRAIGGGEEIVWWIGGAGVVAAAVERGLLWNGVIRSLWRHFEQRRSRSGMALRVACIYGIKFGLPCLEEYLPLEQTDEVVKAVQSNEKRL